MKNKGFTLIELLAVISVMAVIAAIVITNAYSLVKGNREEQYDVLLSEVNQSVKMYLNDNYENYIIGRDSKYLAVKILQDNGCGKNYIKLSDLVNANLIKESDLIDVRSNQPIPLDKYVEIYYDGKSLTVGHEFLDSVGSYCENDSKLSYSSSNKTYNIVNINDYVSFNNQLWRIIGINKDGSIKLLLDGNIGSSVFGKDGNYNNSYVLSNIQYWYIYDLYSESKDLVREASISLLSKTIYDMLSSEVKGSDEYWLVTSDGTGITTTGNTDYNNHSSSIKFTLELKPSATYVSGDGTSGNPYTFR